MKVSLVTTWGERCGIAEYAKALVANVKNVEFEIVDRTKWSTDLSSCNGEVIHLNHEPGLFGWLSAADLSRVRQLGKKIVMTLHASRYQGNRFPLTPECDRIVVHEPNAEGFVYIPLGIPEVEVTDVTPVNSVGTAGFPMVWKGFIEVAKAAKLAGMSCQIIAPESPHANTVVMEEYCRQVNPDLEYISDFRETQDVVRLLAQNKVNVFAYSGEPLGISGAVRLGLAAKRPLVLSRCGQFKDLFQYEDEIEFVQSSDPQMIACGIQKVLESGKQPKRVLQEMSWSRCGELYEDVYRAVTQV